MKDYLDDLYPAAALIGACNTVTVGEDGKLTGHNTDGSLSAVSYTHLDVYKRQ